ncbi:hypothetical protein B0H19DRAFT_1152808 [Mycena capillaripes]|nr:hypothetical protein B0H19DRAFT_1152808 [Mycena capillaripes]
MTLDFAPADISISSSYETQTSGVGNAPSSPIMDVDPEWASNAEDVGARPSDGGSGTIAPPQLPDPTHPRLTGNYASALRDNLHGGADTGSLDPPFLPTQQNTPTPLTFTFTDSSRAPYVLTNYGHLSYPIHRRLPPNETRPRNDDLHNGTGVPPLQGAVQNAPPVLPFIAHGAGERFVDALLWLNTGTKRDGVAFMHRIAHQLGYQISIIPARPPVSWLPPQPIPNSSTIHTAPTLPELGGAGIGYIEEIPHPVDMSYAPTNNPHPAHTAAEERPAPPQRFRSSSTTHPTTTRSDFGGHSVSVDFSNAHMNLPSFPPSASSTTSPQGNCSLQPPFSSPGFNHGATPAFFLATSRLSRMLGEPNSPARISPTLHPIPDCRPGHELQPFTREHDTNPSSSTQGAFDTVPSKKRRASGKARKPGRCARCTATDSSQWRRDPVHIKVRLCNSCGQKAHKKKREQEQEQERNGHAG